MVLAAALEEGVVSESDTFVCTGSATVADRTIKCSKRTGHGTQTLAQAVANSCNPAFIALSLIHILDTMLMPSSAKYTYISSSVVKEMARYGADLSDFVPREIIDDVNERMRQRRGE